MIYNGIMNIVDSYFFFFLVVVSEKEKETFA